MSSAKRYYENNVRKWNKTSTSSKVQFKVTVQNKAKIERNLRELRGFAGQKRSIRDAAYKALTPAVKAMKGLVPVRKKPYTGKQALTNRRGMLKRSIGKKKARRSPVAIAGPRITAKTPVTYAGFLEAGVTRKKQGSIRPVRFRDRAVKLTESQMNKIMSRELDKALDKYIIKALKL